MFIVCVWAFRLRTGSPLIGKLYSNKSLRKHFPSKHLFSTTWSRLGIPILLYRLMLSLRNWFIGQSLAHSFTRANNCGKITISWQPPDLWRWFEWNHQFPAVSQMSVFGYIWIQNDNLFLSCAQWFGTGTLWITSWHHKFDECNFPSLKKKVTYVEISGLELMRRVSMEHSNWIMNYYLGDDPSQIVHWNLGDMMRGI